MFPDAGGGVDGVVLMSMVGSKGVEGNGVSP